MKKCLPALLAAALIIMPAASFAWAETMGAGDVPADAVPAETRKWPIVADIERDADTGELRVHVRPRGCLSVSLPIKSENIRVDLMPATDMFWQMEPNHIRITGGYEVPAGRQHVAKLCQTEVARTFRFPDSAPIRYSVEIVAAQADHADRPKPKAQARRVVDFSRQAPSAKPDDCPESGTQFSPGDLSVLSGVWRDARDPAVDLHLFSNPHLESYTESGDLNFAVSETIYSPVKPSSSTLDVRRLGPATFDIERVGKVKNVSADCALVANGADGHMTLLQKKGLRQPRIVPLGAVMGGASTSEPSPKAR
jgi:hypothetical protein